MATLIRCALPEPVMHVLTEGDPMPKPPAIGEEVLPANGRRFSLAELQAFVGVTAAI